MSNRMESLNDLAITIRAAEIAGGAFDDGQEMLALIRAVSLITTTMAAASPDPARALETLLSEYNRNTTRTFDKVRAEAKSHGSVQ